MSNTDLMMAVIVRLFGTLFIWLFFYPFPVFLRDRLREFPNERPGCLFLLINYIPWIFKKMLENNSSDDDLSMYVLQRVSLFMIFGGVIVNIIGDLFLKDDFIASLGVEIIAVLIIARTLSLFMEFLPSMTLSDFQNKTAEDIQINKTSDEEAEAV